MSLTTNLVSYWKLDESSGDAADSVASNTLANQNTTTYVAAKINNGANIIRASSQGFQIADASQTGLDITGDFSVSFWVKHSTLPATDGSSNMYYIDKRKISTNGQYSINYSNQTGSERNLVLGQIRDSSNNISSFRSANIALSTVAFQHLVFVFTAATPAAAIYVDNVSQSMTTESSAATSIGNNDGPFTVGYAISPGTVNLDAVMDEIGIWSRTLSSTEVSQLYNGGAGLSYPFAAQTNSNFFMFMPN